MSWEHWFRDESISSVRSKLKGYERSLEDETRANQNAVGSKYPELLALADRLESLNTLGSELEKHVSDFATQSKNLSMPRNIGILQAYDYRVQEKLQNMLVSLADRSLVQEKFAVSAHAIYLTKSLNFGLSSELRRVMLELNTQLDAWLSKQTQLPRSVYNACLIHFQLTPYEFLARFLKLRKERIDKLLIDAAADAFRSVDSTTFIYDQVVSDLSQSRLSQRKLVDLTEFSDPSLSSLLKFATQRHPEILNYRCFPDKSYTKSSSDLRSQVPLEPFIELVARSINSSNVFSVSSSRELVDTLSSIVFQAQSALSADTSMALLLDALLPVFSGRLSEQIRAQLSALSSNADELGVIEEAVVVELRRQCDQLAKLARQVGHFAPNLPTKLEAIVNESTKVINDWIDEDYHHRVASLSAINKVSDLKQLTSRITALHDLNNSYQRLFGSPDPVPRTMYETTAALVLREWSHKRKYWGDAVTTGQWDLLLLLDKYGISYWEKGLDVIRDILLGEVNPQQDGDRDRYKDKSATDTTNGEDLEESKKSELNGSDKDSQNSFMVRNGALKDSSNEAAENGETGESRHQSKDTNKKKKEDSAKQVPQAAPGTSTEPENSSLTNQTPSASVKPPQKSQDAQVEPHAVSSHSSLLLHPLSRFS